MKFKKKKKSKYVRGKKADIRNPKQHDQPEF